MDDLDWLETKRLFANDGVRKTREFEYVAVYLIGGVP
jgi:hypothetical protein